MLVASRGFGPAARTATIVNFAGNFAELDGGRYFSRALGPEATAKVMRGSTASAR